MKIKNLFKITLKSGREKTIKAKDLEDAEKRAPKTWVEIIMVDKTKGIVEY